MILAKETESTVQYMLMRDFVTKEEVEAVDNKF